MNNISTSLKLSLFSFICSIIFTLFAELSGIVPLVILSFLSGYVCAASLIAWVCLKIFHKFKYSVNIILIIIFSAISMATYLLTPDTIIIENLNDIFNSNYITRAWIASVIACCISILVLIARIIFSRTYSEDLSNDNFEKINNPNKDDSLENNM